MKSVWKLVIWLQNSGSGWQKGGLSSRVLLYVNRNHSVKDTINVLVQSDLVHFHSFNFISHFLFIRHYLLDTLHLQPMLNAPLN